MVHTGPLAQVHQDSRAGKVVRTVLRSRSGKEDLPPHRPRKFFDREQVVTLHRQGLSMRQIARRMKIGLGTVTRTLEACSKSTPVEKDGGALSYGHLRRGEIAPEAAGGAVPYV